MIIPLWFMRGKLPLDPTKTVKPLKSVSMDPEGRRSEWASSIKTRPLFSPDMVLGSEFLTYQLGT